MRNGKLYACAALILLLAVLRFCYPQQAGQAQLWAAQTIDPSGSCRAFACTLGKTLDGCGLRNDLIAVFRLGEEVFR